jgi:hypothetical protein
MSLLDIILYVKEALEKFRDFHTMCDTSSKLKWTLQISIVMEGH